MMVQEVNDKGQIEMACSDCGRFVECRILDMDTATHSRVELCLRCWNASRQRQVFSAGCCG
jgi:hypothetical protein